MATEEDLQKRLTEKDELISSLKDKTKIFVAKLKEDHINELNALKHTHQEQLEKAKTIMLKMKEENESLKAQNTEDKVLLSNLEIELKRSMVCCCLYFLLRDHTLFFNNRNKYFVFKILYRMLPPICKHR